MITDKEETRQLRQARVDEKRTIKDLNQTGKRLEWVREKLELTQSEVCEATGIPKSSYCGREAGIRPEMHEEWLVLSQYFDAIWKAKYSDSSPQLNGEEVKRISVQWLMFGADDIEANAQAKIDEYRIWNKEMERELWDKEMEMKRQLDLFIK